MTLDEHERVGVCGRTVFRIEDEAPKTERMTNYAEF